MSLPEFELVDADGLDEAADIRYNGATIRVHGISFTEPVAADEKLTMHVKYTVIKGSVTEDDRFRKDLGDIVWSLLEKHYGQEE